MPLTGSFEPLTQASWWLPWRIHSSGQTEPGMRAMTSCAGTIFQSKATLSRTFVGPGPMW